MTPILSSVSFLTVIESDLSSSDPALPIVFVEEVELFEIGIFCFFLYLFLISIYVVSPLGLFSAAVIHRVYTDFFSNRLTPVHSRIYRSHFSFLTSSPANFLIYKQAAPNTLILFNLISPILRIRARILFRLSVPCVGFVTQSLKAFCQLYWITHSFCFHVVQWEVKCSCVYSIIRYMHHNTVYATNNTVHTIFW